MHPKFTAFSGKKINVFNLKLTRRFTLLIFCFHAAELLFSISSVYWIHVFLVRERDTAETVRGPFVQFWARGRGILPWFRTRPQAWRFIYESNYWVPYSTMYNMYVYIISLVIRWTLRKCLLTIFNAIDFCLIPCTASVPPLIGFTDYTWTFIKSIKSIFVFS